MDMVRSLANHFQHLHRLFSILPRTGMAPRAIPFCVRGISPPRLAHFLPTLLSSFSTADTFALMQAARGVMVCALFARRAPPPTASLLLIPRFSGSRTAPRGTGGIAHGYSAERNGG